MRDTIKTPSSPALILNTHAIHPLSRLQAGLTQHTHILVYHSVFSLHSLPSECNEQGSVSLSSVYPSIRPNGNEGINGLFEVNYLCPSPQLISLPVYHNIVYHSVTVPLSSVYRSAAVSRLAAVTTGVSEGRQCGSICSLAIPRPNGSEAVCGYKNKNKVYTLCHC